MDTYVTHQHRSSKGLKWLITLKTLVVKYHPFKKVPPNTNHYSVTRSQQALLRQTPPQPGLGSLTSQTVQCQRVSTWCLHSLQV